MAELTYERELGVFEAARKFILRPSRRHVGEKWVNLFGRVVWPKRPVGSHSFCDRNCQLCCRTHGRAFDVSTHVAGVLTPLSGAEIDTEVKEDLDEVDRRREDSIIFGHFQDYKPRHALADSFFKFDRSKIVVTIT